MKVDFVDFQFFRFEPNSVTFVSGTATPLLRSGGLFVHLKFKVLNLKLFKKYDFFLYILKFENGNRVYKQGFQRGKSGSNLSVF